MSSREIISRLQRDGWVLHRTRGSHWIFKHPNRPDALVVPHPRKEVPKGTLADIMRSAQEVTMHFPIAIHKDPGSEYGVTVPDLPGCFSAGSTVDEAMLMAREAIELYLDTLIEDGCELPTPSEVEALKQQPEYTDAMWAFVSVDYDRKSAA